MSCDFDPPHPTTPTSSNPVLTIKRLEVIVAAFLTDLAPTRACKSRRPPYAPAWGSAPFGSTLRAARGRGSPRPANPRGWNRGPQRQRRPPHRWPRRPPPSRRARVSPQLRYARPSSGAKAPLEGSGGDGDWVGGG